uniref:Uncharacterized protein n=1 Tax=Mustela putorius furo TaxID=9669 RepID=M3YVJ4_MUSPF
MRPTRTQFEGGKGSKTFTDMPSPPGTQLTCPEPGSTCHPVLPSSQRLSSLEHSRPSLSACPSCLPAPDTGSSLFTAVPQDPTQAQTQQGLSEPGGRSGPELPFSGVTVFSPGTDPCLEQLKPWLLPGSPLQLEAAQSPQARAAGLT